MKLSDIMLDLGTGDASKYDAYVQEAVGQVKVSAAIYDAALQIASLDDYDRESIIQEAANAGLPSDKQGAINLTYDAVGRELIGTVKNLYAESAIFVEHCTSPTSTRKAFEAIGKKFGVKRPKDVDAQYIAELADAIFSDKDELKSNTKVVKASSAKKATAAYINAVVAICNMLGIAAEKWLDDDITQMVAPAIFSTKSSHKNGVADLNTTLSIVKKATNDLNKASIGENDYTEKASKNDVAMHLACMYAIHNCCYNLKMNLGEDGGAIEKKIESMISKIKKSKTYKNAAKELNSTESSFDEKPIVELNQLLCEKTKGLVAAFNNTSFAIISAITTD